MCGHIDSMWSQVSTVQRRVALSRLTRVPGNAFDVYMTQLHERMTTAEVADAFGVSAATIRRWVKLQRIPFQRLPSGRAVFVRAEIEPLVPGLVKSA